MNTNEIQIPSDKHHQSVLVGKKSPKHTQFCQIWSNMKMSNNPAEYEVLIKQYLHSVLDISEQITVKLLLRIIIYCSKDS